MIIHVETTSLKRQSRLKQLSACVHFNTCKSLFCFGCVHLFFLISFSHAHACTCTCTCIHVYSCSNAENSGKSNIHTKAKFNRVMYLLLHLELPAHVVQPVLDHIHKLLVVDVVVVGHAQVLLLPLLPALLTLHLLQTVTVKRVSVL